MQERAFFWVGTALALLGVGVDLVGPQIPYLGYAVLLGAAGCFLRALHIWASHRGWTLGSLWTSPLGVSNIMSDKSTGNVFNVTGDNNEVSNVHVGNVTVNQAAEPELKLSASTVTKNADGTHTTAIPAEIIAPYPPGSVRIEAWGEGILGVEAQMQRTGMMMCGHTGVRADHAFTTIQNPFGHYLINVKTRTPTHIKILYGFNT